MNNLWKKETAQGEYVDLFASVENSSFDMYVEILKMKQTRKDNQRSTELRMQGNELFRLEKWLDAMVQYDESLRFAEVGSENVALAYANRSACLFHLMHYKEVLVDIELAKNENLLDRLIPKLQQRKSETLKLMSMIQRNNMVKFEPKLDYKADKNFPCMANVLEIKYNKEFGRHLVAKCDIPVGRRILMEKDILKIKDEPMLCYTCLRVYMNGVACPNCPDVAFCSFDCMKQNRIHNWECGSFFPHLERAGRFEIKTLLIAIESFSNVDDLMQFIEDALLKNPEILPTSLIESKSKYHFFFKLAKSAPCPSALTQAYKVYKVAMNLPKVSVLFDSERKKRFLMHLVMHHILISNTNAIEYVNSMIVANFVSLANHSCAPNLIHSFFSGNVFCVTGRPVRKGEQLFINYIYAIFNDIKSDAKERKTKFKTRWGIDCKCERCEPTRAPLDQKLITSDPSYKYVVENQHNIHESAIIQGKCVEFLNKYGRSVWSPEIEFVFKVYGCHLNGEILQ